MVAALPYAYDDARRPGGFDHLPQRVEAAQELHASGSVRILRFVVDDSDEPDAHFRMFLNMPGYLRQDGTAADQQQTIATQQLQQIGAEDHAPGIDPSQRHAGAGAHHMQRHAKFHVNVAHQTLNQKSRAQNETELLQQHHVRGDVDVGVEIVQVKTENNRDHGQD